MDERPDAERARDLDRSVRAAVVDEDHLVDVIVRDLGVRLPERHLRVVDRHENGNRRHRQQRRALKSGTPWTDFGPDLAPVNLQMGDGQARSANLLFKTLLGILRVMRGIAEIRHGQLFS